MSTLNVVISGNTEKAVVKVRPPYSKRGTPWVILEEFDNRITHSNPNSFERACQWARDYFGGISIEVQHSENTRHSE